MCCPSAQSTVFYIFRQANPTWNRCSSTTQCQAVVHLPSVSLCACFSPTFLLSWCTPVCSLLMKYPKNVGGLFFLMQVTSSFCELSFLKISSWCMLCSHHSPIRPHIYNFHIISNLSVGHPWFTSVHQDWFNTQMCL